MDETFTPSVLYAPGANALPHHFPNENASQDPDRLLNEAQLAQLTNLSVRTLQAWRLRGEGPPFIKIGRSVRYKRGVNAGIKIHQWPE